MCRPVAQLAESRSPKPVVGGSSPSWPARYKRKADATDQKNPKLRQRSHPGNEAGELADLGRLKKQYSCSDCICTDNNRIYLCYRSDSIHIGEADSRYVSRGKGCEMVCRSYVLRA